MRALVQRVRWAEVEVDRKVVGRIDAGLLVYIGIRRGDGHAAVTKLAEKIVGLRIFEDEDGKLNRSVRDARGGILAVPNFTLVGDARRGRRPDFTDAARPEDAEKLYEEFVAALALHGSVAECGVFRAHMTVRSAADGPVNVVIDVPPECSDRSDDVAATRRPD